MIYGQNVRLRKIEREDLPKFVEWFNDPEVREGVAMVLPLSQDEETQWYENMLERPAHERPLAIEIRSSDEAQHWRMVGSTGLFRFDWRNRNAEFGITIGDKRFWNQGYGTETTQLILQHGFQTLNLHRVYLRVFASNPRARRAYEKAGFTLEGTLRQAEYQNGQYVDIYVMSVLQPEWNERD